MTIIQDAKLLANTDMKMVGPAAHVATVDKDLAQLQGFDKYRSNQAAKERGITMENHQSDWVGRIIGLNPYTIKTNVYNKGFFKTTGDIFFGKTSPHNCYGAGNEYCVRDGYRTPFKQLVNNGDSGRDRKDNHPNIMYSTYTIYELQHDIHSNQQQEKKQ